MDPERFAQILVGPDATIRRAIEAIDAGTGAHLALVVDAERRLLGTVTDGDVRRALLHGADLDAPVATIAHGEPVTTAPGAGEDELHALMERHSVEQIPIVEEGRVVDVALLRDLAEHAWSDHHVVLVAGGEGRRLRPLTEHVPKPMLPVGDRPLLERTIDRLRDAGVHRVAISTHHLADRIIDHFGNGAAHGVEVGYLSEDQPLGTAGALRLLGDVRDPMVVINGDVLTGVDFRGMLAYHREHGAAVTVGVRRCELQIPYGVLECDGPLIRGVCEKPRQSFLINAGVYLVEPTSLASIPEGRRFDMTDLMMALIAEGKRVVSFPIVEYWLDIGQPSDYEQAQVDIRMARLER